MIPERILDFRYSCDIDTVKKAIDDYDFRGSNTDADNSFIVCRIGGYRYVNLENGCAKIIGWQCNMADIQNYDVKLPTIIEIVTDGEGKISSVMLADNFKGSQGIPCSHTYLNRKLQKYTFEKFRSDNKVIADDMGTACRHTFELLYGACTFKEWCDGNSLSDCWLSETTSALINGNDEIESYDTVSINGSVYNTKIIISNFRGNIRYNIGGDIADCKNIRFLGFDIDGEEQIIGEPKILDSSCHNETKLKTLKILNRYWKNSGLRAGVKNRFYFSHLWPPTFFGILNQMFAVAVFNNSYSYFQHCIQGLQKASGSCACVGVCENINECSLYFPDFEIDDLL